MAALFAASPLAAHAEWQQTGQVDDVTVEGGNQYARIAVGTLPIPKSERPVCHTEGYNYHFAIDISTVKGKAIMTMAMSAMLAGKTVIVTGTGSCLMVAQDFQLEEVASFTINQ